MHTFHFDDQYHTHFSYGYSIAPGGQEIVGDQEAFETKKGDSPWLLHMPAITKGLLLCSCCQVLHECGLRVKFCSLSCAQDPKITAACFFYFLLPSLEQPDAIHESRVQEAAARGDKSHAY